MPKCNCPNENHGHTNPCGREGIAGTDSLCTECSKKAAGEQAGTVLNEKLQFGTPHKRMPYPVPYGEEFKTPDSILPNNFLPHSNAQGNSSGMRLVFLVY